MKKEVDVIIIGADVCSLITANLLSKKGYRVAIVDNAIGLGGNQLYIPVSLKLVQSLGLNLNNPLIIRRTID
ncbi:MAG: NAD(P)-binding protein, partial [Nitrososphaerota archaeon]